jgi:hypothetical protein
MPPAITTQSIVFENNRTATAVFPTAAATASEIAAALNLPVYSSVLFLIGGADSFDEKLRPRVSQLLGRGIARAAIIVNALIIDGGTQAGVMEMMGEGVAARGYKSSLLGVAPGNLVQFSGSTGADGVALDPNHSHFVLVPGDTWGSETSTIFKLIAELSSNKQPVVALIVGGGTVSKSEVLQAVRQNIPLIVVAGSGGIADQIAKASKSKQDLQHDPIMAEIIADGGIELLRLDDKVKLDKAVRTAQRSVVRQLATDRVLLQAWDLYADYDSNATLQQHSFNWVELAILAIGVVATGLALVKQVFSPQIDATHFVTSIHGWWFSPTEVANRKVDPWIGWWLLKYLLISLPIVVTVLITATNKFKQGNKWLLLRAGAESIKREIYRYRARTGDYGPNPNPPSAAPGTTNDAVPRPTPEQVLAQRLELISQRTMQTEVNASAIKPFDNTEDFPPSISKRDDGFSTLTPNRYIQVRLDDQSGYYDRQTVTLARRLKRIQWSIYIIGGLGTLLAAIDQQVWIALTTALAAALTTFLSYKQTENTLTKYNQTATDLNNVKRWWTALPVEEKAKPDHITILVDNTERVLQSELDGWVQQMQNALADLRKGQPQTTEGGTIVTTAKPTKDGAATNIPHDDKSKTGDENKPEKNSDKQS